MAQSNLRFNLQFCGVGDAAGICVFVVPATRLDVSLLDTDDNHSFRPFCPTTRPVGLLVESSDNERCLSRGTWTWASAGRHGFRGRILGRGAIRYSSTDHRVPSLTQRDREHCPSSTPSSATFSSIPPTRAGLESSPGHPQLRHIVIQLGQ